jgi:hypothetical protein
MAQVDPDQLAALQPLPAAFGHVEVLEADPPDANIGASAARLKADPRCVKASRGCVQFQAR